jgi:hypothetical protein
MRHLRTLIVLCFGLWPTALFSQEWKAEADLVLASAYEWRGLRLDSGSTFQFAAYGSLTWGALTVSGGAWSLTGLSSDSNAGLPNPWGAETTPWIEAALGGDRRQAFVGAVAYLVQRSDPDTPLRRGNSREVYAGARGAFPKLPVHGEAILYWDVDRIGGAYGELAGALQIPVWNGLVVPVGSFFLEARTGFSLGQEATETDTDPDGFLFGERGVTHVDFSLRTTLLPLPLGPASASINLELHRIQGLDPETRRIGFGPAGEEDPHRWSWVMGVRITFPRCRPERELCRDL